MEDWVTCQFIGREAIECDKCSGLIKNQRVHMYVNVDNEIEEVLCEQCWMKVKEEEKIK